MLQQIDQFAGAHGYTRSGFLAQAAKRAMDEEKAAYADVQRYLTAPKNDT